MASSKSQVLLEQVMAEGSISAADLDQLVASSIKEDLYLEYKDGRSLAKKDASRMVREYVSAFANSDGGVLMVGIEDKPVRVGGCSPHGSGTLEEWAARCLTDIAGQLSPPPRILVVHHGDGDVLVVATARAPGLVAVATSGEPAYYVRLGEQTLRAESYLVADLLLGRRERPTLSLVSVIPSYRLAAPGSGYGTAILLNVSLRNDGVVWTDDIVGGGLVLSCIEGSENVPPTLRQYVDAVTTPAAWRDVAATLMHVEAQASSGAKASIAPFKTCDFQLAPMMLVPNSRTPYRIESAVYFVARGSPVAWYQVALTCYYMSPNPLRDVTFTRVFSGRPRVAWTPLPLT